MPADLSQLINDLNDSDPARRAEAAQQLCRLGEEARCAAVPLVRATGDDSEDVCEWATAALEELGAPSAADSPALADLLDERNADIGYWAATLLGRLEGDGKSAVAALAQTLMKSPHMNVRQRAAWALGRIGPPAAPAVAALEQAANSGNPRLARLARQAIERITTEK